VEELEYLEKKNRRKAEEKKQKTAIIANAFSSSKNPPGSNLYSGDTPFLSPDFVFNKLMFLSSQVNTAFASILTELLEHSEDA
jgi:hypothetical protein